MHRLCEDELMCIRKYAPMPDIGISNERLYNEIKLLDPTFSMIGLHRQLLQWKNKMAAIEWRGDDILPLYGVLRKYQLPSITGDSESSVIIVRRQDADVITDELTSLHYNVVSIPTTLQVPHVGLLVSYRLVGDLETGLAEVDQAMLYHPLYNIQYRSSRSQHSIYSHYYRVDASIGWPHIPDDRYNHELYMAINAIDPSIDMNYIYDVYMHKHARENAPWPFNPTVTVKDMYPLWYPHLDAIESITVDSTKNRLYIRYKHDNALQGVLSGVSGWTNDDNEYLYIYNGPNVDTVYDAILAMLRMYYSYGIPHVYTAGIQYYPM